MNCTFKGLPGISGEPTFISTSGPLQGQLSNINKLKEISCTHGFSHLDTD